MVADSVDFFESQLSNTV